MEIREHVGEPRLLISRAALHHNARVLRQVVGNGVRICAVVKADGYGHGAATVVDSLINFGQEEDSVPPVDQFAVATIDEAANLPSTTLPVLILRAVENAFVGRQRDAIELAIRAGWVLTIDTRSAADDVARIAIAAQRRALVNVMLDTGMTRGGCAPEDFDNLLLRIHTRPTLKLVSVGTHFSNSEHPTDDQTKRQLELFHAATDDLAAHSRTRIIRHAANSGATFFAAGSHFDMVRPGLALYGLDPMGKPSIHRPLRPVARWSAPLTHIRTIRAGTTVGYGSTWRAPRDSVIGLVPVGYADGYARDHSNKSVMSLHEVDCPVCGRVNMDATMIDITDVPSPVLGDTVTVMDNNPISACSVYRHAELCRTIPYEVLCRIGQRVKRVGHDPLDRTEPRRAGSGQAQQPDGTHDVD
jgi:alanine racemase